MAQFQQLILVQMLWNSMILFLRLYMVCACEHCHYITLQQNGNISNN